MCFVFNSLNLSWGKCIGSVGRVGGWIQKGIVCQFLLFNLISVGYKTMTRCYNTQTAQHHFCHHLIWTCICVESILSYHHYHHYHHHYHYYYILYYLSLHVHVDGTSKQWMKMNNFRNIQSVLGSNNNCLFWGCYQSTLAVIPSQWHCKSGSDMFGIKSAWIWRISPIIPTTSSTCTYVLLFWNRPKQASWSHSSLSPCDF